MKLYKHPRIYHVPWSPGLKNDDRRHPSMEIFESKQVIVTIKMDGENTTMYNDAIHARSIDSQNSNHPSRDMIKNLWGNVKHLINEDERICGENIYAEHSIKYNNLYSYFYVFSMWFENLCFGWNTILTQLNNIYYDSRIKLYTVPIIYEGIYDEKIIKKIGSFYIENGYLGDNVEGYVIRNSHEFEHDFNESFCLQYAKYVRENHVQTDEHWLRIWNKDKINKIEV
jgi:hypothetical protein